MTLKELDLTKYYEINRKLKDEEFSNIIKDISRKLNDESFCISYAMHYIYGLKEFNINDFVSMYGTFNDKESNVCELFGMTMENTALLIAHQENDYYGHTILDIVANFAIQNNLATEDEIIKEACQLYEINEKKQIKTRKQKVLSRYNKDK